MKRLFRPTLLLWLAGLLTILGVILLWRFSAGNRLPQPIDLQPGEQEIAWLAPATGVLDWERFVAGVRQTGQKLQQEMPELEVDLQHAYPQRSIDIPEASLVWKTPPHRLTFRWYKVTSGSRASDWITALLKRDRPPLAVLGGSNSESALSLARQLQETAARLSESRRPLLLLTTATAESVEPINIPGNDSSQRERDVLLDIYPGRTFRFCFNNTQMARAVIRLIWNKPDLQPEGDPVYFVQWMDDTYSLDLTNRFTEAIRYRGTQRVASMWAWTSGCALAGATPSFLAGGLFPVCHVLGDLPQWLEIPSSVGSPWHPNRHEFEVASQLDQKLSEQSYSQRSLLCVTGQSIPSRRFLRALVQFHPERSKKLIIAMGDVLSLDNIYRDRRIFWPIQDLPMALIFFMHANPIDATAGFHPPADRVLEPTGDTGDQLNPRPPFTQSDRISSRAGTEDVLFNVTIVEALARVFGHGDSLCTSPQELAERLKMIHVGKDRLTMGSNEGRPFFGPTGDRRTGTGEHVVCLRPLFEGNRILPSARLEVWRFQPMDDGKPWKLVGVLPEISYAPPAVEGGIRQ